MKTRILAPILFFLILIIVTFLRCRSLEKPTLAGITGKSAEWIPVLTYLGHHGTSGALIVGKQKKVSEEYFWTWRSDRVDAQSLFNIGSISKQFTGFLVLQLIVEGKVRESQTVSELLREMTGTPIGALKLNELLSMTSGLAHDEALSTKIFNQLVDKKWTSSEILDEMKKYIPQLEPGSAFHYSNLNYILVAQIIARIEGQLFEDVLKKKIFIPFKMNDTFLDIYGAGSSYLARGHLLVLGRRVPVPNWNYSFLQGAGGIVSNVRDLHKWLLGLSSFFGRHVELTDKFFGYTAKFQYGFGWGTSKGYATHSGETPGFCSYIATTKTFSKSVILTLNSDFCASGNFQDELGALINSAFLSEQ